MDDISKYSRIVIKIGSSILIDEKNYQFRSAWLKSFAEDIAYLVSKGVEVIIVSSGAIASGCMKLGRKKKDFTLEEYQALAAYGQLFLGERYNNIFSDYDLKIAQILLTIDDYQSRRRYLNIKSTINRLLNFGIIPIVNENDTVATDEIRFGDNDNLAAKVSVLSDADLLIIFSDVKGLYDKSPKEYADAKLIRNIPVIDDKTYALASQKQGGLGTGGMLSKLRAIESSGRSGVDAIIASGMEFNPIKFLSQGEYSFYKAVDDRLNAKRKWLLHLDYDGVVVIDQGAELALKDGNSLLAVGIKIVKGEFAKGDIIRIENATHDFVGQGIVNYNSEDLVKIIGVHNNKQSEILNRPTMSSVIHLDNMVFV